MSTDLHSWIEALGASESAEVLRARDALRRIQTEDRDEKLRSRARWAEAHLRGKLAS